MPGVKRKVDHRRLTAEPVGAVVGVQFKAAFLRAAPPTTLEGIERYLGSGMIRGIGPA